MSFSSPPSRLGPLQTLTLLLAAVAAVASDTVDLGTAGEFAILSKAGITTVGVTSINGDMGTSPIAGSALTGFGNIMHSSNQFSTSSLVAGQIFAADYAVPTPSKMTTAVSDMETAYTDAQGRTTPAPISEFNTGDLSGQTLSPGLYKWSTSVKLDASTTLTFDGGINDVWIMQIAGSFNAATSTNIVLTGGAKASNIIWAVAQSTKFGADSHVEGVFLTKEKIVFETRSSGTGAFLAQTAVTLDAATIVGVKTYYAPINNQNQNAAPGVAPIDESDAENYGSVPALVIAVTVLSLSIGMLLVLGMSMKSRLDAYELYHPIKAMEWRKGETEETEELEELEVNTEV